MIAHRPENEGGGAAHRPPASGATDDAFDFRWIPEPQQAASAAPVSFGASSRSVSQIARREDVENRIVIALTIACTVLALFDLFLLASGV